MCDLWDVGKSPLVRVARGAQFLCDMTDLLRLVSLCPAAMPDIFLLVFGKAVGQLRELGKRVGSPGRKPGADRYRETPHEIWM